MRLLCTIDATKGNPIAFSHFLTSEGIQNQCEEAHAGHFNIWVIDEDEVERAQSLYTAFEEDPSHHRYSVLLEQQPQQQSAEETPPPPVRRRGLFSASPYGPLSICIIAATIGLFIWAQLERHSPIPPKIEGVIQAPVLAPIEQILLYDYPDYFVLRDDLLKIYTFKDIEDKVAPSPQAKQLIERLRLESPWMGAYDRVVMHLQQNSPPPRADAPMFQKIRGGQVWRLFTPALLHLDFLHIFFNLLWFIVLGNQIEHRIGGVRYLLLVLLTAAVTNTAQYLVSGPFFMGLSGVVCGMAAFIWARQQVAPWEGYLLHRFTLIFLGLFVIGMFVLQSVFFFLQIFGHFETTIGIANTAHIMGGVVGYLLGRMRKGFAINSLPSK